MANFTEEQRREIKLAKEIKDVKGVDAKSSNIEISKSKTEAKSFDVILK